MKAISTLILVILFATAGITSFLLFADSNFYGSAVLTIAWYLSLSLLIAIAGSKLSAQFAKH